MLNKTSIFVHKNKTIYFTDYSGMTVSGEIVAIIDEAEAFIKSRNEKDVLYLIDISGSLGSIEVIKRYKEFGKAIKPYIKKDAVIGASISKEAIINMIRNFSNITMKTFKSKEEALDYLTT